MIGHPLEGSVKKKERARAAARCGGEFSIFLFLSILFFSFFFSVNQMQPLLLPLPNVERNSWRGGNICRSQRMRILQVKT